MTMENEVNSPHCEIRTVGLAVMGRNLVLNPADQGFPVAGYDKGAAKVKSLRQEAEQRDARGATDLKELITLLCRQSAVMLLVPVGAPVDTVIQDLLPHLGKGDLISDAGNSHFKDTDLRADALAAKASILKLWRGFSWVAASSERR